MWTTSVAVILVSYGYWTIRVMVILVTVLVLGNNTVLVFGLFVEHNQFYTYLMYYAAIQNTVNVNYNYTTNISV